MRRTPPPFRFVLLAVGLWVCLRSAMLAPGWWTAESAAAPVLAAKRTQPPRADVPRVAQAASPAAPALADTRRAPPSILPVRVRRADAPAPPVPAELLLAAYTPHAAYAAHAAPPLIEPWGPPAAAAPAGGAAGRWSGSAWMLVRGGGGGGPLAPAGTLGGSQAGARLGYRLAGGPARPLDIVARLSSPLARRSGAEAALGLEWRPVESVPVALLAERRQALGAGARSGFALAVHGGVSRRALARGVSLDAYGQAGLVGARSRDPFADGAARLSLGSGPVEAGVGAWAGAQPGASRLDLGPHVALRLPAPASGLRLSAEWRFRIAGDARPGSGPALTLGTSF